MILLTHPRSGSEWFLTSLPKNQYGKWEPFGTLNSVPGSPENMQGGGSISFDAKIKLLAKAAISNRAIKIHFCDIHREMQNDTWPVLLEAINKHDLYFLVRNSIKETLISYLIAEWNDFNFHGSTHLLNKTFRIEKDKIPYYYNLIYGNTYAHKDTFQYKEQFIYEDLIDRKNTPTTLNWNPSVSPYKRRGSMRYIKLIENYEEVLIWIDELIQGNHVQSHP